MIKKLSFIGFIALSFMLVSSLVYAFEFDNVKSYDQKSEEITFKNSFLFIPTTEISKAKLISPHSNLVMPGKNRLVAEFDVDLYDDSYDGFFDNIQLIDKNTGQEINRFVILKYKTLIPYEVNDLKEVCEEVTDDKNGSKWTRCGSELTGTKHTEYKEIWNPLDNLKLLKGKITIGIFTEVKPNDYVEWYPTMFGVKVTEWATWNSSYNIGLEAYWTFNETSGNIAYDALGVHNLTLGDQHNTTGLIGGAYGKTNASYSYATQIKQKGTFTVNIWGQKTTTAAGNLMKVSPDTDNCNGSAYIQPNNDGIYFSTWDSVGQKFSGLYPLATGKWIMFTLVVNATAMKSYINATLMETKALTNFGQNSKGYNFSILGTQAKEAMSDKFFVDEYSIWNRTLSQEEITDLWNSNAGITYIPDSGGGGGSPSTISVTLNLPTNQNSYNTTYAFNATVTPTNLNLTNSTLYIWVYPDTQNVTIVNTSYIGFNQSTFNVSLGENNHLWNVYACGTNATTTVCAYASSNNSLNVSANPVYSNINHAPDSPATYIKNGIYVFNSTWTDGKAVNRVILTFNGTNYTASNTGNVYNVSLKDVGSGNYSYYWWANDTLNHTNITGSQSYNISKGTPPLTLSISGNVWTVNNGTQTNVTGAGCPSEMVCNLSVNDVLLRNNTDNSTLLNGTYVYVFNTTGQSANYSYGSITQTLTVLLTNDPPRINISYPLGSIPYYVYGDNMSINFTLDNPATNCNVKLPKDGVTWCSQPLPNVGNSCGGYGTGVYQYDTYYNYTMAERSNNKSLLYLWDGINWVNYSIPASCWQNPVAFKIYVVHPPVGFDTYYLDCQNSTGWINIESGAAGVNLTPNMLWNIDFFNINISCTSPVSINPGNYSSLLFTSTANNGTIVYANSSWSYLIKENSQIYNENTTSYSNEIFIINITYSSLSPEPIGGIAFLNYSGTMYSSSKIGSGYDYIFTSTVSIPKVTNYTNQTFNWIFTYNNESSDINISSSPNNQTIYPIFIDNCAAYKYELFNFLAVDEVNQLNITSEEINESIEIDLQLYPPSSKDNYINFSANYSSWNARVCIQDNLTGNNSYRAYAQVKYSGIGYSEEYYYIQNLNLTKENTPQRIKLYDLLSASATEFLITYKGSNFLPVENALINLNRKYVGEGVYKTVEIVKTDQEGQATAHFDLSGVNYVLSVYKEGQLLSQFDNIAVFCEDKVTGNCKINLYATSSSTNLESYENHEGIAHSLQYDETTRDYTISFTTLSGGVGVISLNVTELNTAMDNVACSAQSSSTSGTLSCTVPASFNNKTVIAQIFKDGVMVQQEVRYLGSKANQSFEGNEIILIMALFLTLPFLFAHSTIMISLGLILALILSSVLFFTGGVSIGVVSSLTYGIIVLVIVIIKLVMRGSE